MLGSTYRWLLLHPLFRGSLLSLAVAGFFLSCHFLATGASPAAAVPVIAATTASRADAVTDHPAEWPRALLRLWFLVPSIIPVHDR